MPKGKSEYKVGDPLTTSQLYWTSIGFFEEEAIKGSLDKRYELRKIVELSSDQDVNYVEAGRIYYDNLAGEYVVLYSPAKDVDKKDFAQTPFLNQVADKMKDAIDEVIGENDYRQYFLVAELKSIIGFVDVNHYTLATVAGSSAGVVDSMGSMRAGVYSDKDLKEFLKEQRSGLKVSDTKAREWQDPGNNWKCGHYVFAELKYQERAKLDALNQPRDIFKAKKKNKHEVESRVVAEHKALYDRMINSDLISDKFREKQSQFDNESVFDSAADDDFEGMFEEEATEKRDFKGVEPDDDLILRHEKESKEFIANMKPGFWQRHPILKTVAIGGLITLGLLAVVGIGVATGGFAIPFLAGAAGAASTVLTGLTATATAWFVGLGASAAVATGLTIAAGVVGGVIAGILPGALVGAIVGGIKNSTSQQMEAIKPAAQSTHAIVSKKLAPEEQDIVDYMKEGNDELKQVYNDISRDTSRDDSHVFGILRRQYSIYKSTPDLVNSDALKFFKDKKLTSMLEELEEKEHKGLKS